MQVSALTGKPIPASLTKERGRLVDMMTDSHAWLHGKKFALYGDADFVLEPVYDLCIKVILTQRKSDETFLPK